MDENLFFKQATLLICSSLEVEVALFRSFQFLRHHLPADAIYLNIYEPSLSAIRYLATANSGGGQKFDRTLRLPAALIQAIESGERLQDYLIINRPADDPLGKIIAPALGLEEHSFIALRLVIEGQRLGVIDLFAKGQDRFTPEHARLLSQLREPFAIAMANALKHQQLLEIKERLASDNRYLNSELRLQSGDAVVGADQGLAEVMAKVSQIAHLKNTVLLRGETGTGKEVIANAIHRQSPRRQEAFIKVNCGAIPEQLIDSELFGHEKGAFTGAIKQKRGLFERADRGTIFLDEIGELPPWAQVRLLRVLQTQEIERVGGSPPIKLDIRVIAATHRNLEELVTSGSFREDLWFRINMFPIHIPPLRQRREDIAPLVSHFLDKKAKVMGIQRPPDISPGAIEELKQRPWPGNVRELENIVERALIQHRHGPLSFRTSHHLWPETKGGNHLPPPPPHHPLNEVMRQYICQVLESRGGRISGADGAAEILGLHPNTLRHRMQKLGISFGREKAVEERP